MNTSSLVLSIIFTSFTGYEDWKFCGLLLCSHFFASALVSPILLTIAALISQSLSPKGIGGLEQN